MPAVELVDVEGAVRAYIAAYPGLTGSGNPLSGGIHLTKPRIPPTGAISEFEVIAPVTTSDVSHDARVTFTITAAGERQRAREVAEYAARSLARAVLALTGTHQTVQTRRGDYVRMLVAGQSSGPIHSGDFGGASQYTFDATFRFQETTAR